MHTPQTKLHITLLIVLAIAILTSCGYKRKNILLKTPKKVKSKEAVSTHNIEGNPIKTEDNNYKHRIKPGDRLNIKFLNNYDIGQAASQSATSTAAVNEDALGYLVNYDSTVTLPLIGRFNLVGLTRLEAAKKLENEYGKYVINPIIELNIANLSVSILGEIYVPGKIILDKENTTLVDVISLSGGLKDTGKKNRIRIIRGKEVILVDLRKITALYEKSIIIQDGDIIYVEPFGLKAQTESISAIQNSTFVLLTLTQLTIVTIQIINLTRAN